MNPFRVISWFWDFATYRNGGELAPPRPVPTKPRVTEAELLMFEVDRRTGKVRIAAVRKERKQP